MADQTIKVGKSFTQIQVAQGEFTLFLNQNSQYFTVSRSANGDNAIVSNKTLRFSGPATIYVKGTNDESFVVLSDFFKTSSGGMATPTPGQTYNFNAPLVENLGNVSIALSQSLQVLNDTLDLNLNGNQDFKNVLLGLDEAVKLTGNQSIAGNKTFSGSSKFTGFVDVDAAPTSLSADNYCMLRFVGDKWPSGQIADLIRFHKYGAVWGCKVYLNGTSFNYAQIYGQTLISNMIDPTADSHGANVRWVKGYSLPKVTTNAVNTIQVTSSASKYFNFDYVVEGTGYRNWSGIQLRAKQDTGSFETMWKVEYRNENTLGLFMQCVGNRLNFESDTKIVGVSCEDSDGENTAANKKWVKAKVQELKDIVAQSADFNDFKTRIQNL